ncbi:DUF2334 domain-containing protein [Ammoniphilus sp. 3BR4]|uniref:DUF2334 domain-containing protein n=1 Tax=Ammoniphilus sp. 3BR4 TaxID=3158265 RepID=UPI0034671E6F
MWSKALTSLILLFSVLHSPGPIHAGEDSAQVLILYQEEALQKEAQAVANLIGHFSMEGHQELFLPNDRAAINDYRYVFYLSRQADDPNPARLAEEARKKQIPLCLIGVTQPVGVTQQPITYVTYDGQRYPLKDQWVYRFSQAGDERIRATAHDGLLDYPLLFEKQGVWHFQSLQLWGLLGNLFADFLHEFFTQNHPHQHQAFIRIEDIHPASNPEHITKIANLLNGKGIPFMMAVRPVYFNPKDEVYITLDDTPDLVKALQYAADKGGTLILHGYSHVNPVTGGSIEFWDQLKDQPIPQEETYLREKLEEAIAILVRHDLIPLAFQAPYYALSKEGYRIIGDYFTTLMGHIQLSDQTQQVMQSVPYFSRFNGLTVIPETMGYVRGVPFFLEELKGNLEKNGIVRDSIIGVYFHTYLPLERLSELVQWLEQYPLSYISLADQPNRVQTDFVELSSGVGGVKINVTNPELLHSLGKDEMQQGFFARNFQYILWGIVLLVMLFSLLFILNLLKLRKKNSSRLFGERDIHG